MLPLIPIATIILTATQNPCEATAPCPNNALPCAQQAIACILKSAHDTFLPTSPIPEIRCRNLQIRDEPRNAEAYHKRGLGWLSYALTCNENPESSLEIAISDFKEALRLDPTRGDSFLARGIARYHRYAKPDADHFEQAVEDFSRALRAFRHERTHSQQPHQVDLLEQKATLAHYYRSLATSKLAELQLSGSPTQSLAESSITITIQLNGRSLDLKITVAGLASPDPKETAKAAKSLADTAKFAANDSKTRADGAQAAAESALAAGVKLNWPWAKDVAVFRLENAVRLKEKADASQINANALQRDADEKQTSADKAAKHAQQEFDRLSKTIENSHQAIRDADEVLRTVKCKCVQSDMESCRKASERNIISAKSKIDELK